ncbi:MAG: DNA polymerase [Fusobacteriaceae bacterium]
MEKLTQYNTKGKIGNFLATYKNLDMAYGQFEDYIEWYKEFKKEMDSAKTIMSFDIETKKLYPVDNKLTMFAFSWKKDGVYYSRAFDCKDWSDDRIVQVLRSINSLKSKKVLHNAYFDITTLAIMFGVKVNWDYDTYIIFHNALTHRAKDTEDNDFGQENTGLSLKDLTRDILEYGEYEEEINQFKKDYCREHKIKAKEFTYDLIPKEILAPYNCMDTTCTLQLFEKGMEIIKSLEAVGYVRLREIVKMKHEVTDIYINARIRGVYIDRKKVMSLHTEFTTLMNESKENIYKDLSKHIEYVEREIYFKLLEKDMMKDFEYIAENRPKVSKTGKETWVTKQVKISELKSNRYKEESKINFNSSQHKAMLFVDSMGLEPLEKSAKTNAPKCDIKFMEHHLRLNPQLQSLMDYGKCRTAINNFLGVNKLEESEGEDEVGKADAKTLWELTSDNHSYVHSSYNINGTVTGRCSCSSPNIQQYPSRGKLKSIKKCFSAREDHYVLYADFASAEVAIMASIIDSEVILQAIQNGWDLHSINAWNMLGDRILKEMPELKEMYEEAGNDVDKLRKFYSTIKENFEQTYRYYAKSLIFSLAYGTTAHGVSKNLGIPKKEAQGLIDSYLKANPAMANYIKVQHETAKKGGYTENPFGARLLLPDAPHMHTSNDRKVRMRGEKQLKKSLNVPIQSSNAFLLYDGMIRADKMIKDRGYEGKMHFLFSVYDSFCYEVHNSIPKEEAIDIAERAFICYLGEFYLGIDIEIGSSWGDTEGVKRERRTKSDVSNYEMKMY